LEFLLIDVVVVVGFVGHVPFTPGLYQQRPSRWDFFFEPHRGDRATRGGNPSRAIGDRKIAGTMTRRGLFRISNSESLAIAMECVAQASSPSGGPSVSLKVPTISFFGFSRMGDLGSFFFFW
jgi:hypothetical protein